MNVNWLGWDLQNNQFGKEFDEPARLRMIKGGKYLRELLPHFVLGQNILELGPFFTPTITQESLDKNQNLIYLENDEHAIKMLRAQCANQNNISVIKYDISNLGKECFLDNSFDQLKNISKFDTVLFSQILNYVDYVSIFENIRPYLNPGCKLFINNVVNYGIPPYFHEKRPKNSDEIVAALLQLGFKLIKIDHKPAPRKKDENRLLLVSEYLAHA